MADLNLSIDYSTMLEWLDTGDRDLQISALENLCMTLLMSDNVDRCFENCPPRQFLPALCRIFLDEDAPVLVLEAAARAMTYYMEVSNECSRRITAVEGTLKAICNRISNITPVEPTGKDLVEQCVKVLEHICQRETGLVHEAGGFPSVLTLVRDFHGQMHRDTLRSALSVITRLCSKIEPDTDKVAEYSDTLGNLLTHEDLKVSESALRSIAAIVDRFSRKRVDPSDFIGRCGLIERLLGLLITPSGELSTTGEPVYVLSGRAITFISIVLSLLNNLCRGSAAATDLVVRSPMFLPILKPVMTSSDERCVSDGLRLTGMILGLICDGRPVTEKVRPLTETALSERFTEKHKELVDSIRAKNFETFKNLIESNGIDVNYTDDVGQALINWTAAFGTLEMAVYLLDHNANVDGGTRSSSLHYAAIFGRPDMTQLLLERGANPELRDEEGRTALEKARGRKEEQYQKVARLLEYPMAKSSQEINMCGAEPDLFNRILTHLVPIFCTVNKSASSAGISRSSLSLLRKCITKLPPNVLRVEIVRENFNNEFAENLMSMFENSLDHEDPEVREQVFLMMQSVLDRDTEFWREQFARLGVHEIVEKIANEDLPDDEDEDSSSSDVRAPGTMTDMALNHAVIFNDGSIYNDTEASLRQQIAKAISTRTVHDATVTAIRSNDRGRLVFPGFPEGAAPFASTSRNADASSSIRRLQRNAESSSAIKCYRWHDWRIVSAESSVYIWCDYIAIVLNRDGTAQYVAENDIGKVQLFAPSKESDNVNNFMERFTMHISRTNVMRVHQLFDDAGDNWMGFGNWDLLCLGGKNIDITNADVPRRKLHLTCNVAGFSIRSDDGVTTVTGNAKLSKEFETGFVKGTQTPPIVPTVSTVPNLPAVPSLPNVPNLPIIKPVSHKTATRQRVNALAKELWNRYLCYCKNNMRLELKLLKSNARAILDLFEQLQDDDIPDRKLGERRLYNNLLQARHVLLNDNSLSIFEIGSSGIVQTLQILFEYSVNHRNSKISRIIYDIFSGGPNINVVVRKIVQVMESQENFPVVRYDKPNSSTTGMKLLTRRFYLNLEQANPQDYHQQKLVDNTGRSMKTDPLTTVAHFKLYFLQMLSKFWFDADRSSLAFVQKITEATEKKKELVFEYTHNFDKNGIVYYLGTNGHTEDKWVNPITSGLVTAVAGDSKVLPFDPVDEIFSRDESPANCHTFDKHNAKFVFDLGVYVHPTVYTLRHSEGYDNSALRTWNLEGSADNYRWFVISRHENDRSLMAPGDTASWAVNPKVNVAFRYFRIAIKGPNSSGKTHFLSCSGFEIYGNVVGVEPKKLSPPTTRPRYPVDTGPPVVNQHSWAFCAASDPENDDHLWDAPSNVPVDVWRQPPPNAIDNSEPPMPLSDNDRSQRDRGLSRRSRRPSAADRYHDAPAAEPKLVSKVFRPKSVVPVEQNPVKLQGGYNVRYVHPSKNQAMFGYISSIEKDGRVVVYWDYGERVLTNPSELGVLINQIPTKDPTPEPVAGSSSASVPSSTSTKTQQKSMSTTNLLDERVGRRLPTFQAVSADSLQNPTVSLENLIGRSRLFAADRIPEVGDEQSPSDAPESVNAENAPVSVAASTFGGGSHPLLSYARRSAEHNPTLFGMSSLGPTEEAMRELNDIRRRRQADNDAVAALASAAATAHESAQELFNEEDEAELEESDGEEDPEAEDEEEDDDDEDDDEDEEELEPMGGADEYYVYAPTARATSQHIQPPVQAYAGLISEHGGTSNHAGIRLLDSAHVAFAEAAGSRGQSSSTSRPARVADYADALRTVMQQVIDAAGSEEVDDDLLFNDDYDEEDGNIEDVNDINDVITHGLSSLSDHASFRDSFVENMFYHTPFGHHDPGRSFVTGGARSRIPTSSESAARAAFRQYVNMPGHLYDILPGNGSSRGDPDRHNHGSRKNRKPLRHWDDDFTLKPAYSALIPVFDPRPGRNNVNQTQDVELPSVSTPNDTLFKKEIGIRSMPAFTVAKTDLKQKDLRLYLRGPNVDTIQNVTVEMANDDRKFVYYAQKLLNMTNWKEHAGKRHNRIWDPTFTLIYEVRTGNDSTVEATHLETGKFSLNQIQNEEVVVAALEALFSLKRLNDGKPLDVNTDQLISEKLTQKINLILSDPLVVAGNALPDWVEYMLTKNKHLFDLETRRKYHMATAFGTARSIVWTQTQLDSAGETNTANAAQSRREDSNDYRIGRLKHERIKVPRDDDLFATAVRVFRFHAIRKSVLEIQYIDEEGTGLGPTLEFFALVAAEFQRKSRAIWICDDDDSLINKGEVTETDLGSGLKPAGYYIRRAGGLFPAPIPPQTEESYRACELFRVLGIFLAKVIQDNRLVDIPLSLPLLRLLIEHPKNSNLRSILTLDDFDVIYPEKARFVRELGELISLRDDVLKDCTSRHQRSDALRNLNIALPNTKCTLDELGLTYVVDPPSNVFEYRGYELIPDGSNVDVTLGNVNEYVEHVINFHLNTGIRPQIDAFREGFNLVCPLKSLSVFTPNELLTTMCGDQSPQWTAEELYKYTAPKNGYTVESTTFRRFVEVLVEMNAVQRKAFLQFATGCSSLPPGGLANLHPPLTIVRKGESDDGAYPSVNTCVHYLKMPDYSTKELLRERLFSATLEKGFYLN